MGLINLFNIKKVKQDSTYCFEVKIESKFDHLLGVIYCKLFRKHLKAMVIDNNKDFVFCLICGKRFDEDGG